MMTIWTIYHSPSDYPGKWVLRAFDVTADGHQAREECVVADSLEAVRAALPRGRVSIGRMRGDDPAIYECWT